jgi:AcrR family transcriptional regulator
MSSEIGSRAKKRKYELRARADSQRRTRERIVRATMELHKEVGPAKTTVAEVARRAGVQRLTVYNHFPRDIELFGACQAHWMGLHPLPDFAPGLALSDPSERVGTVLRSYYAWYRETEPMAEKIQRDRGAVPELNTLMEQTADTRLAQLTGALAKGFRTRGRRADTQRALLRLALDFWTWRRLNLEGLDDAAAAALMTDVIGAAATAKRERR